MEGSSVIPFLVSGSTHYCEVYPALLRGVPRTIVRCARTPRNTAENGVYPALLWGAPRSPRYRRVYPAAHYCGVYSALRGVARNRIARMYPTLLRSVRRTAWRIPHYCGLHHAMRSAPRTARSTPHCGGVPRTIAGCIRSRTPCTTVGRAPHCGMHPALMRMFEIGLV